MVWHGSWSGAWADGSFYYNNVFYHLGQNPEFRFESSTNNVFSHNAFFGEHAYNEPLDPFKITADPAMVNPGPAGDIHSLDGFMLTPVSPLIKNGMVIPGAPQNDFYGNPLGSGYVDIGVHETLFSGLDKQEQNLANSITLFPNPTNDELFLLSSLQDHEITSYTFLDLNGRQLFAGNLCSNGNGFFTIQISLSKEVLPEGMYFIRFGNKGEFCSYYYKIIVNYP